MVRSVWMTTRRVAAAVGLAAGLVASGAGAADNIKIGLVTALSGQSAKAGGPEAFSTTALTGKSSRLSSGFCM